MLKYIFVFCRFFFIAISILFQYFICCLCCIFSVYYLYAFILECSSVLHAIARCFAGLFFSKFYLCFMISAFDVFPVFYFCLVRPVGVTFLDSFGYCPIHVTQIKKNLYLIFTKPSCKKSIKNISNYVRGIKHVSKSQDFLIP